MKDQKCHILIADDDANDIFLLNVAFTKAGFGHSICSVPDGKDLMRYLTGEVPYSDRGEFPIPDLLLLDLKMPFMNGFDVLEWLRTRPDLNRVPAVVLSSSCLNADVTKAQELGAADYRVKPNDLEALISLARELDARWLHRGLRAASSGPGLS